MNKFTTLIAGASALLFSTSAFAVNALEAEGTAFLDWEYNENGTFFDPTSTGLITLSFEITDLAINGFDANSLYEWCVSGDLIYDYGYFDATGPTFLGDFVAFDYSFVSTFADLPLALFDDDPFSNPLSVIGLPGLDLQIPQGSVNENFFFDPFTDEGLITLDTDHVVQGSSTSGQADIYFTISAKPAAVPDSGTTGLMAFAGFGLLIAIRRSFGK